MHPRIRWSLKKAARAALAVGTGLAASNRRTGAAGSPRLRVLMYHRFGDTPYDPFSVSLRDFEAQMAWLARRRLAVSLAQAEEFLAGTRTLPDGAVLVTVDDGLHSLYARALPVLRRYRIPAVAFIPAGLIDVAPDATGFPEPLMTWPQIAELGAAGVAIGSHAWTHRSLGRLPAAALRLEAEQSRRVLEQRIGSPVTAFAYPFGTRADYNATAARIVQECGYTSAFTAQHGAVRPGLDRFTLPRVKVEGGEPLWMFALLCRGGLDGWKWVDRTLWRLQASEGHGLVPGDCRFGDLRSQIGCRSNLQSQIQNLKSIWNLLDRR
jgi:peptidoglycan/xylan/chitin deacetylase (PgdA/CDA1 family)